MNSRKIVLFIACGIAMLFAGAANAASVNRPTAEGSSNEVGSSSPAPAKMLTYSPGRAEGVEARNVVWGRRYYGRPYVGYYSPAPRYYSGYRGYYQPYYGGYPDYYGPPRYRNYNYPYGAARVGPVRVFWR
jgi:hypothetical protein